MKSLAVISLVLATPQCMAEPSGAPASKVHAPDAGVVASTADAGTDASDTANDHVAAAAALLRVGPAPFTVPTHRIAWPQHRAMILVPEGARVDGDGTGATVAVGEGRNFKYRLSASGGDRPDPAWLQSETTDTEREDGAIVWRDEDRWYFRAQHDTFSCWNPLASKHNAAAVEMMIASCLSIETAEATP